MYSLLTVAQIREIEQRAGSEQGLDALQLMRDAGEAIAEFVRFSGDGAPCAIVCGPGNNGGDGWAAARILHRSGYPVKVFTVVDPLELDGIAGEIAFEATSSGIHWEHCPSTYAHAKLSDHTLIIDALLGIGVHLPLREDIAQWCSAINDSPATVIAIDVPTGVDADSGECDKYAVVASRTLTFIAAKVGLALGRGALCSGDVAVAPLGVDPSFIRDYVGAPEVWVDNECGAALPLPAYDANKYTRGRLLVIGGSRHYHGAALLAAHAATRSGAGYVVLATPHSMVGVAQAHQLTVPVVGLEENKDGSIALRALEELMPLTHNCDAIVIGPGMGTHPKTATLIRELVSNVSVPVLLDADGLNAFVGRYSDLVNLPTSLVLTPHAGEAARLLNEDAALIAASPLAAAARLMGPVRTVVMKGTSTVIACPARTVIDVQGPATLATAGTGDVLAGIIGAFMAQGVDPHLAATLGVRLQARSAAIATEDLTPLCVNARDVIEYLPAAARSLNEYFEEEAE